MYIILILNLWAKWDYTSNRSNSKNKLQFNPLSDMPILESSTSAANKYMMSKN